MYALAYYNRGNAKRDLTEYQAAITDQRKAIEINPYYIDAYRNISIAKEKKGDLKGACSDATKAVSLGDQLTAIWLNCKGSYWYRKVMPATPEADANSAGNFLKSGNNKLNAWDYEGL